MRSGLILLVVAVACPTALFAGPRDGDALFDAQSLDAHLTGQVLEFFDGSKSQYNADRSYGYTYTDDGPVWSGTWTTDDQSRVCVAFDNGSARCDHIVLDGQRTVLITLAGDRFPVRNITVYGD